jgi:hypothetical protein
MEVLVPVCGKEPGQGFGPWLCFALQGGTDKAAHRAIGGLKGGVKRGQWFPPRRGGPGSGGRKTPAEQIELGGGSAAVAAFKNNKIAYNVHNDLIYRYL